jgi:hypothetical protein
MQRQMRFAIQSVMVAVAMAALNLGGAIAVSKTRPRAFVMKYSRSSGQLRTSDFPTDALRCLFRRDTSANLVVKRALQEPLAETLAQIWSPVIASASFTILVLALSLSRPLELRRGPRGQVDEIPRERPMRWRQVTNRVMIAVALIGLNFAGAVYPPTLGPAELELALQWTCPISARAGRRPSACAWAPWRRAKNCSASCCCEGGRQSLRSGRR